MKQTPHAYSDEEIARYVLGLDMAERTADIQARLARDDAAAARALKWEAYFLGIVDALPAQPAPPDTVLERICQSLGMNLQDAPVMGDVRVSHPDQPAESVPQSPRNPARRSGRPRLRRGRVALVAGIVVVLCLAGFALWAGLQPPPAGTLVEQPVQLDSP